MITSRFLCAAVTLVVASTGPARAEREVTPRQPIPVEVFPLPAKTVFQRHVVGAEANIAAGERLIYSNTLSKLAVAFGANRLVADDIATTAPNNCNLRRLEFPVVGKVDPAGIGGPYTVDFAIYTNCPNSVPLASRPALIVPGTAGQAVFDDDAQRLISFVVPDKTDAPLNSNFWLGVSFNRANAGVLMGAPATIGFSADSFDFPGIPCGATLGEFPQQPHASFNAEIYGDAKCAEAFAGYKNSKPWGSIFNPGANTFLADDLQLGVNDCQMIGYEVAVKGLGFYTFEMRNNCDGSPIAGSLKNFTNSSGTDNRIARFNFDPPIPLPQNLWFAARINNNSAGMVITGKQADIGQTDDLLGINNAQGGCTIFDVPGPGFHAAFNVAITCAGSPPVGACCDMIFSQCAGGLDDGLACCPENADLSPFCYGNPAFLDAYPPCTPPGTCESACRDVPQMNCSWPPRFTTFQPAWAEGASCDSDSAHFPFACGKSACCRPDDVCENRTQLECAETKPLNAPRQWQRGQYCGQGDQVCLPNVCQFAEGDCMVSHAEPGCGDRYCCTEVCGQDPYCCAVEWDRVCVEAADVLCDEREHDECYSTTARFASLAVEADSVTAFSNSGATESPSDPEFCCHPLGTDQIGYETMWFKFIATDSSARVSLCHSDPSGDSLFQVFSVVDPSTEELACVSLKSIACGDDSEDCGDGRHAEICLDDLGPGQTYHVMVASKSGSDGRLMQLEIQSPCFEPPFWSSLDCNGDQRPDGCALGSGAGADCNNNLLLDECEIADGISFDCDGNAILDDCVGLVETLRPMPPSENGALGHSLDMNADWLVVGTSDFYLPAVQGDSLHFFHRIPSGWREAAPYPLPHAPAYVDMDGNWIVATSDHDPVAYVFRLQGDAWSFSTLLRGPELPACPRYGFPVAVDGDWIALGKGFCQDYDAAPEQVFLFHHDGAQWVEEARVEAPNGPVTTSFGAAVSLHGDRLLVGAPRHSRALGGAAHVFRRENGSWVHETTLTPPDGFDGNFFGRSVALEADFAFVGATLADGPGVEESGAVYVFRHEGSSWFFHEKLTPVDAAPYGRFGWSVRVNDNTLAVGATSVTSEGQGLAGAVYLFGRRGLLWSEIAKLVSPAGETVYDSFGHGVAVDGTLVAVGAPATYWQDVSNTGSAFVFQLPPLDCNENNAPDLCDVRDNVWPDCNHDGVPDECTLTDGTTPDCNHNDNPDDCDPHPPFDYDFDGDVDLTDLAGFQRCFTGPGPATLPPCCKVFNSEPDSDIDLTDFVAFKGVFTGP